MAFGLLATGSGGNAALEARQGHLETLTELVRTKERIAATLLSIAATFDALPAKVVRLRGIDDASSDDTVGELRRALAAAGGPVHYRLVVHRRNLGLAGTLNETFAGAKAPFVLTCHLDCRFGSDGYVASLLELMTRHPDAAAITGQPTLPPERRLLFNAALENLKLPLPAAVRRPVGRFE